MTSTQKTQTIITHNGGFHTDEVFACAVISLAFPERQLDIIRTRDEKIIATADFVVDVGGIYDPPTQRFDHHQVGGAGVRDNGIPYASLGLVWKEYGEILCGSLQVAQEVENRLVLPIDAGDNGVGLYDLKRDDVKPYLIHNLLGKFLPTWNEHDIDVDTQFIEVLNIAMKLLEREIIHARDGILGSQKVQEIYTRTEDKRIIILDGGYPWRETLMQYPEPLFMIAPRLDGKWKVEAVYSNAGSFDRRKYLPEVWAGKRDKELAEVTGVKDAVFCHNHRFLCVAETREGIVELAKRALED